MTSHRHTHAKPSKPNVLGEEHAFFGATKASLVHLSTSGSHRGMRVTVSLTGFSAAAAARNTASRPLPKEPYRVATDQQQHPLRVSTPLPPQVTAQSPTFSSMPVWLSSPASSSSSWSKDSKDSKLPRAHGG